MTAKYRTKGFVFKKEDRFEADRVFSVFTEDFGRIEIMAKAIRKITSKLKGNIDMFSLAEIEFIQGKNYKTLTDAVLLKKPEFLTQGNFESIYKISFVLEQFIKGQEKDGKTFELVSEVLDRLGSKRSRQKNGFFYYCFFWNFLSLQGYKHEADNCVCCRGKMNPSQIYFSFKDGGIVCSKCSIGKNAHNINSDVVKILRLIFKKDWETLSKLRVEEASRKLFEQISDKALALSCPS